MYKRSGSYLYLFEGLGINSQKAKIDMYCSYINILTGEKHSCAIEMKFFKKANHREPNNRYDVFADIHNLENYGSIAECCFMVIATDHDHYVSMEEYSPDTADFDFRHGVTRLAGTMATYRTQAPYGAPITLAGAYTFAWDTIGGGLRFLKLAVKPQASTVAATSERAESAAPIG